MGRRVDIRAILNNPVLRRKMMTQAIVAIQAREGIETTIEQAEAAYDKVYVEKGGGAVMTLGEFRKFTKDLPDSVVMEIFHNNVEWYGAGTMAKKAWRRVGERLVYCTGNDEWSAEDMVDYIKGVGK